MAAADPGAGAWLQVTAALLFQAKAIAVMGCVLVLRFATGQVRIAELSSWGARYLVPGGVLLLVGNYFWALGGQSPLFAAARVPLSYGLFFLCASCAVHVLIRVAGHLARERPRSAVNPWL